MFNRIKNVILMDYFILFLLPLSASNTVVKNYQNFPLNDLSNRYPELTPFNNREEYTNAFIYCLVNEKQRLDDKIDFWRYKTDSWSYRFTARDYKWEAKNRLIKDFF